MSDSDILDVLIVGAGISGIGGAVHLSQKCPDKRFLILEGRSALGGTWDLFRYPGIRSDSDMYTLGFVFKPWTDAKAIADAPAILNYLRETVAEFGLADRIKYDHRVTAIDWSSEQACWTVTCNSGERQAIFKARFLYMGTGYYSYTDPYRPEFKGSGDFNGQIIHPQFWPEKLDYSGKKVVVIGSGATAVTIVPAMVENGVGHITMLQRTPSYIVSRPAEDKIAISLRKWLPGKTAYWFSRWKNILGGWYLFRYSKQYPEKMRARLADMARAELGPDFDIAKHLDPPYDPWDQRLCLVPDSDFWKSIRTGRADIETAQIDCFTAEGVRLTDGRLLPADIIITATGLKMEVMSGVAIRVDGREVKLGETVSYKGFMYSDVPNIASAFGYSNASWTLKADLIANYVCRLLNYMDGHGYVVAMPHQDELIAGEETLLNLNSGYVERARDRLPKLGPSDPWRAHHNYFIDRKLLQKGPLDDAMMFRRPDDLAWANEPELAIAAE